MKGLNRNVSTGLMVAMALLAGLSLSLAGVGMVHSQSTRSCELRGHPSSVQYSENDNRGDDHRDIVGKKPNEVTYRLGVSYEFALHCSGDDAPKEVLFWYRTLDGPLSGLRGGFVRIRDDNNDFLPSLAVLSVQTGDVSQHTFSNLAIRNDQDVVTGYEKQHRVTLGGFVTDTDQPNKKNDFESNKVCSATTATSNPDWLIDQKLIEQPEEPDKNNPKKIDKHYLPIYKPDIRGNYELLTHDWMPSVFVDADGEPREKVKLYVTFCSRGSGNLMVGQRISEAEGWALHSKEYRIVHSRLAVQLDNSPGGPVAAQVLLSLLSALLFWLGAMRFGPARPFIGLTGMMVGAMALPVFGHGSWFWAILLVVIGVLFGYLYATMISGKT